jgi:hypothetical protein
MKNLILLQGPPFAGKDTIGRMIMTQLGDKANKPAKLLKFATPMNTWMMQNFGVDCNDGHDKEAPCQALGGLSRRQAAIKYSEDWIKPTYGKDHFGKIAANTIDSFDDNWFSFIFTDSGFKEEGMVIINEYGAKKCRIIKVYREGKTFKNDSRGYWSADGVQESRLDNEFDTEAQLLQHVRDEIVPPLLTPTWA